MANSSIASGLPSEVVLPSSSWVAPCTWSYRTLAISATVHARTPCTTQPGTPSPPARRGFLVHATSSFASDASPRATASRGPPAPHLGRLSHRLWSTPALARRRRCFPLLSTAPLSRVAAGGGTCQVDPSCLLMCPLPAQRSARCRARLHTPSTSSCDTHALASSLSVCSRSSCASREPPCP